MAARSQLKQLTAGNTAFRATPWLALGLLACVTPGAAIALDDPTIASQQSEGSEANEAATAPAEPPVSLNRAETLSLTEDECVSLLTDAGVQVERLTADDTTGVEMPVRLRGPIDGVTIALRGHDDIHAVLDCRLGVALLGWAPTLRARGITRVEHYSIYRPGARTGRKRKPSGHARGMAIDAARFHFADGRMLDVLDDWGAQERGVDPCLGDVDNEAAEDRTLRELVCDAIARQLFTVVLTPHHDKAHDNHVHLELVPDVTWTYVR